MEEINYMFIDSPLQPEYELSMKKSLQDVWLKLLIEIPNVTDYHFSEFRNEFYNTIRPLPGRLMWVPVITSLWTDIS